MALQWVNVFDLPGVVITSGTECEARPDIKAFQASLNDIVYGVFIDVCTPDYNRRATITLSNNPGVAGYTFSGRQRVSVLTATSTGGGGPWPARVHHVSNGNSGEDVPIGAYIATHENGGAESAACIAGLELDGTSPHAVVLTTHGGRRAYSWVDSQLYRWTLELEIDFDPPPAPLFWQDFIGCKEVPNP